MENSEIRELMNDLESVGLQDNYPSILVKGERDILKIHKKYSSDFPREVSSYFVVKSSVKSIEIMNMADDSFIYVLDRIISDGNKDPHFVLIDIENFKIIIETSSGEKAFRIAKDILNFIQ